MVVSVLRVQEGMSMGVGTASPKTTRVRVGAFVGYVLYSVYVCMTFYSPTAISSVVEIGYLPKALYLFYLILGRMIAFAVSAVVLTRRKGSMSLAVVFAASAACAFVGFAMMAVVFQLTAVVSFDALLPWFFATGVWIGLGDALAIVLWFSYVGRLGIRSMYVFLVASAAVGAVLCFATTFFPAPIPWIVAAAAFFGSLVCCARAHKGVEEEARFVDAAADRRSLRHLVRPLLGVVLMAFMAGLMMNVAGQERISLATYQWTAFVTMFALNGIMLLPALLVPRAFSVPRLYKFILPLSVLGFLLLPVAWDASGRGMVNSFVQVGFTFTNVIFFCLIAEEHRRGRASSAKVFCLMQLAVTVANFAGLFLAFFGIGYLEPGDLMLTITALVAVYLILAATLVLFKDKSLSVDGAKEANSGPSVGACARAEGAGRVGSHARDDGVSPRDAHVDGARVGSERSAQMMEQVGLSAREQEVLWHLRQGRAPKTIAKVLVVSENTVRFHIRNIYQKFGVHSRTELMELFDEELGV